MKTLNSCIILLLLFGFDLSGQVDNLKKHSQMNLDCKQCHICDTPTKADPCLVLCPRYKIKTVRHSPEEGPNEIELDEIKVENDLYSSVYFTHKLHAEMSLLSGGCSSCHHFNPPGNIVKCITCHNPERIRDDISVPDLKAAYHRQCLGCHKTWEDETKCESCHLLNSASGKEKNVKHISENVHPKIIVPTKLVFDTNTKEGNIVTFFHNDHSSIFGLECTDCHTQESCVRCHNKKAKIVFPEKIDKHLICSNCHETKKNCKFCHNDELTQPFNHLKKTGFALENYHAISTCNSCHKTKNKFTGLKPNCEFCHKNNDGLFKHSITGVKLDDVHSELECKDCHDIKNFKQKPSCDECHENYNFPNEIPGEKVM